MLISFLLFSSLLTSDSSSQYHESMEQIFKWVLLLRAVLKLGFDVVQILNWKEMFCILLSGVNHSLLQPPDASLCYLWLIHATLNLALIVNVRGEMRALSLLCLCRSRTWSLWIRWFWILTKHLPSVEKLFIDVTAEPLYFTQGKSGTRYVYGQSEFRIFHRNVEMSPLCHCCWQKLFGAIFF